MGLNPKFHFFYPHGPDFILRYFMGKPQIFHQSHQIQMCVDYTILNHMPKLSYLNLLKLKPYYTIVNHIKPLFLWWISDIFRWVGHLFTSLLAPPSARRCAAPSAGSAAPAGPAAAGPASRSCASETGGWWVIKMLFIMSLTTINGWSQFIVIYR